MSKITIKPIRTDEWLPDRCLNGTEPFDPKVHMPAPGCPGMNYFRKMDRKALEQLYEHTISKYGGCGFIAWDAGKVIAYHNFFPFDIAREMKFFGCGEKTAEPDRTLVHNCLTIINGDYSRKGICRSLVKESVGWAKINGWKKFEVHMVLPDCERGWQSDQKSCLSFWQKFGFEISSEYEADNETRQFYSVTKRYSMLLSLDC